MIKERIKALLVDLEDAPKSFNCASDIIDGCRKITASIEGNIELKKFQNFNLKLSMKPFSYMINEGLENIEKQYWEDSVSELIFDLKLILRHLEA